MNFGKENSGLTCFENTVMHPAQILPNPDPSIAEATGSTTKIATCTDLENMNFGEENSGLTSIENTIVHPAQVVPNLDPLLADIECKTLAFKKLIGILQSPASAQQQQQQVLAIMNANQQLLPAIIKQRKVHVQEQHQLVLQQQWLRQILPNEVNMTKNDTMRPHQVLINVNPHPSISDMQRPAPALKQYVTLKKSPASDQQQQNLTIMKANPPSLSALIIQKLDQQMQQPQLFLQQHQLFMQQYQQRQQLFQEELQHHFQRQRRRLFQRLQRREMLRERYGIGYSARSRRVLPNQDPSIADMPTEDCQQILETLKALQLE